MSLKKLYHKIISNNINNYKRGKDIKSFSKPFGYQKVLNSPINDIINCGAPRSGSTLLNIILNEIISKKINNLNNFCSTEDDYKKKFLSLPSLQITKTHLYSNLIAKRIEKGHCIGFFTHRDIRDVIVSYIQKGWVQNVDDFLKNKKLNFYIFDAILYAKTKNMIVISYEELLNNKIEIIRKIAIILKVNLSNDEIDEIDFRTSPAYTKKSMQEIEFLKEGNKEFNSSTGLHKNHINDPQPNKWKKILTQNEIKIINNLAFKYLEFFNYPKK